MLSYSERERAAYCAGHTRAAELLGALGDMEDEITGHDCAIEAAREAGHSAGYDLAQEEVDLDDLTDQLAAVKNNLAAMGKLLQEVRNTLDAKGALDRKVLSKRIRTVQWAHGVF